MNNVVIINRKWLDCPVCGQGIYANFSAEVNLTGDINMHKKIANGELLFKGMRLNHNCIPSTPRAYNENDVSKNLL